MNPHYIIPEMLQFRLLKIMDEYVAGTSTYYQTNVEMMKVAYPGFYYRTDKNFVDEENWHCFVNSIYDKESKKWICFKPAHEDLVDKSKLFK